MQRLEAVRAGCGFDHSRCPPRNKGLHGRMALHRGNGTLLRRVMPLQIDLLRALKRLARIMLDHGRGVLFTISHNLECPGVHARTEVRRRCDSQSLRGQCPRDRCIRPKQANRLHLSGGPACCSRDSKRCGGLGHLDGIEVRAAGSEREMLVCLLAHLPIARPIDGGAIDLQPISHGAQTLNLWFGNCAVRLRADVDQEVAVAAHHFDHLMHHAFDRLVPVPLQVTEGSAEGGATLPLRANHLELEIVLLQTPHPIGPVTVGALVVAVDALAANRARIHVVRDHAADLVVEVLNLRLRNALAHLVAVTSVDGEVIHPQHVGMVLLLEFLPAGDVVVHERFVVAKLWPVEHLRLGNAPDLLGNVGTRLTVNRVLRLREEPSMTLPVIGWGVLQPLLPDGLAEVTRDIPFRSFVDRVPRRQIRVPVGPAVMMLGNEYDIRRADILE